MAIAVVGTVWSKLPGLAGLGAVPSRPPAGTAAQPRHVVAVAVVATIAAAHAAATVGGGRTGLLAKVAGVAGAALAMAALIVADPVAGIAEGAGLPAAHPVEALRAGLVTARPREPRAAAAGAGPSIAGTPCRVDQITDNIA